MSGLKVPKLPYDTSVVTALPSLVRHHLVTAEGDEVACAEFAEIIKTPATVMLLRVFHAIPGVMLVPTAAAGVASFDSVSVVLVAVLFVVSVTVMTKVCVPDVHVVESKVKIAFARL